MLLLQLDDSFLLPPLSRLLALTWGAAQGWRGLLTALRTPIPHARTTAIEASRPTSLVTEGVRLIAKVRRPKQEQLIKNSRSKATRRNAVGVEGGRFPLLIKSLKKDWIF